MINEKRERWLNNSQQISVIYLHCRSASEGIVTLGVKLCICDRRISLGGEGNALYPVVSVVLGAD